MDAYCLCRQHCSWSLLVCRAWRQTQTLDTHFIDDVVPVININYTWRFYICAEFHALAARASGQSGPSAYVRIDLDLISADARLAYTYDVRSKSLAGCGCGCRLAGVWAAAIYEWIYRERTHKIWCTRNRVSLEMPKTPNWECVNWIEFRIGWRSCGQPASENARGVITWSECLHPVCRVAIIIDFTRPVKPVCWWEGRGWL